MIKVYIASPYSTGDQAINVRRQIDAANELLNAGFIPFVPLLTHFQHIVHPRSYEEWLDYDLELLIACDAVLRLDGQSNGADIEVKTATKHQIPVFFALNHLKEYFTDEEFFYLDFDNFTNQTEYKA